MLRKPPELSAYAHIPEPAVAGGGKAADDRLVRYKFGSHSPMIRRKPSAIYARFPRSSPGATVTVSFFILHTRFMNFCSLPTRKTPRRCDVYPRRQRFSGGSFQPSSPTIAAISGLTPAMISAFSFLAAFSASEMIFPACASASATILAARSRAALSLSSAMRAASV